VNNAKISQKLCKEYENFAIKIRRKFGGKNAKIPQQNLCKEIMKT